MGQTVGVERAEARRILGVGIDADDDELRAAHRRRIRLAHPDAGGSAAAAAELNAALALLRQCAGEPDEAATNTASTTAPARRPGPPPDVDGYYRVDAEPGQLLARLVEAGHEVGEVVFVDPHVGLLEIVVGRPPAVGQLAVAVGATHDDRTEVCFTLEPLGVTPAPAIGPVVDALMAAVRR